MTALLTIARRTSAAIGIVFAMSALGGLMLGIRARSGAFLAIACMSAGFALTAGMWWHLSRNPSYRRQFMGLTLLSVCLVSGLALYSNLVYLLWGIGLPLDIGTVKAGKMGNAYWLPPLTLRYAVVCYVGLTHFASNKQ
ncbi:hypothetical protein [Rugamonas aquatica]|uniref:Uncharacterized protein n=1 Tax=Rugamonas aquatica TaxID=2743357 RepID=A0A6A7N737_9BURK|nr:hypothetical protein [Rugamonas aquatica]MQA40617.1 hypothetical protein [Rugamonas aquatica]